PVGAATVALLLTIAVAGAAMVQLAVSGTFPPEGRGGIRCLYVAAAEAWAPPHAPAQVQVQVSEAGKVSATVVPGALLGPGLLAEIGRASCREGGRVGMAAGSLSGRAAEAQTESASVAAASAVETSGTRGRRMAGS